MWTKVLEPVLIFRSVKNHFQIKYISSMSDGRKDPTKTIVEGKAHITTTGNVFYNPVQEFNRDLSISVLSSFAKLYTNEKSKTRKQEVIIDSDPFDKAGVKYENGITVLEGLSATGLRSIRYAKEVAGIKNITANDISLKAVQDIEKNIVDNQVEDLITSSHSDVTTITYSHRDKKFDAIDLDPYGCPSIFLDGAVQAVNDGGLLLITATDMAVLAGNTPETCYSKYGAISLRLKACHEMGVRILLQCIESHANRYGRYIVPLLSISADFYARVFVRIFSGAYKCKYTTSKLSMVHHCTGCGSFLLQPLGVLKNVTEKQVKFGLPTGTSPGNLCEHCKHPYHMGGPIWSAPIHDKDFINRVLLSASETLGTYKRIEGVLNVVLEELDTPLYYGMEKLSGTLHAETMSLLTLRSAILNAGFEVSSTHMNKSSIKTNAPAKVLWDIMRCWVVDHPINPKRLIEGTPAKNILDIKPEKLYSLKIHEQANPESRRKGFLRFQANPLPYWGPGTRSTAMCADEKISKSKKNQGKRKREPSVENNSTTNN